MRSLCTSRLAAALCLFLSALAAGARADDFKAGDSSAFWPGTVDLTRSSGMGGAHSAIATGNDALLVNPAGLSQTRRYHFQLDGGWDSRSNARVYSVSVVDSASIAAGSGLFFQNWSSGSEPDGRATGWLGGAGYSYFTGNFFFGGTTKYVHFNGSYGEVRQFLQDVGLLVRAGELSFSAVVQNLSTASVPLFPVTSTLGLAYGSDADWHLAIDYKTDLSDTDHLKHKLNGGLEILFDRSFVLRGGYSWDLSSSLGAWSLGTSIVTDKVALHAAWRRRISGPLDQFFEAGITVYLE
jgi:hypothetical protein